MGGQTALNLCIEADDKGIWKDFGVEIVGVDIEAINITEDREKFRTLMLTLKFQWHHKKPQNHSSKEKKLHKNSVSIDYKSLVYIRRSRSFNR